MGKKEVWKPVVGAEEWYSVSSHGRVRSEDREVAHSNRWGTGGTRTIHGKIRKPWVHKDGHLQLDIYYPEIGRKNRLVHQLVMEAFVGPCPEGLMVRHRNGDASDNRLENLTYGTSIENNRDMLQHGTHYWANRTHCRYGHPYNEDNTYWRKDRRGRECKACGLLRNRRTSQSKG